MGLAAWILAWGAVSCTDEIAAPTRGTVEVHLSSSLAGGFDGGRIVWGDSVLVADVEDAVYEFVLPGGAQVLSFEKPCALVTPSPEVSVDVQAGRRSVLAWSVDPGNGVEVTSSMSGAAIYLDGAATGKVTPATLDCVPPGEHTVAVALLGAAVVGGSVRTVQIEADPLSLQFELEPLPQARGAMLELFTATFCTYCGPADEAAELLWGMPDFQTPRFAALQVHKPWPTAPDVFATPSTVARDAYYNLGSIAPVGVTSGLKRRVGFPSGETVSGLAEKFREDLNYYMNEEAGPTPVALYWLETDREPGVLASGTLRVMLLQDVGDGDDIEVWALDYKDGLETRAYPDIIGTFHQVVRTMVRGGSLTELGLTNRGDWTDVAFQFPLDEDTDWTEEGMGLVAFVQDISTKEVYTVRHAFLP
jgi:hypothetical protein